MTRSPFSELRVNKMEEGKRRNAKESKLSGADKMDKTKRDESLQEAFKKFRKERQVINSCYTHRNFSEIRDFST